MLVDQVKIKIHSGTGGRGSMSKFSNKPYGGDGGHGGDVYFKGSTHVYDLGWFDPEKTYKANNGTDGTKGNKRGEKGKDLIINVPLVTEVYVAEKLVLRINKNGQIEKLLNGGIGGFGNITKKMEKITDDTLINKRRENQSARVHLVLKLQSDIIFVGYPNAGKSSMLNELTNSDVKTAPYAFTTLDPQIGLLDGIKLMDLPGLIEGTHEGRGLGTKFLKHTENSKVVAHFVSLENEKPYETYTKLREEVRLISKDLFNKKEIVVLTKTDELDPKKVIKMEKEFQKKGLETYSCSIIDDESIARLKTAFKDSIAEFNNNAELSLSNSRNNPKT